MKQREPRILYLSLLAAAIVSGAAGFLIERFVPTNELAPKHAAATTPIALALTSPAAEVVVAIATCIMIAWMLTFGAFWCFWRISGGFWRGPRHEAWRKAKPTTVMIVAGLVSVASLPSNANQSWFGWTWYGFFALLGIIGLIRFAFQLVSAMHPLLRAKRE